MEEDKYYSKLTSITFDSMLHDREIKVTHHSNKPIICKNIN